MDILAFRRHMSKEHFLWLEPGNEQSESSMQIKNKNDEDRILYNWIEMNPQL